MYCSRITLLCSFILCLSNTTYPMAAIRTTKAMPKPVRTPRPTARSFKTWLHSLFNKPSIAHAKPTIVTAPAQKPRTWSDYFKKLLWGAPAKPMPVIKTVPFVALPAPSVELFKQHMLGHINAMHNSFYSTEYTDAWRHDIIEFSPFINTPILYQHHEKTVLQIALEMLTQYHASEMQYFITTARTLPPVMVNDAIFEICRNGERLIHTILNREGSLGDNAIEIVSTLLQQLELIKIYEKRAVRKAALELTTTHEAAYFHKLVDTIETILKDIARREKLPYNKLQEEAHQLITNAYSYHTLQLSPTASLETINAQYKKLIMQHDPSNIGDPTERKKALFISGELQSAFKRLKKQHQQSAPQPDL